MRRLLVGFTLLLLAALGPSAAAADRQGWLAVDCGCRGALSIDAVSKDLLFLGTDSGISRSTDGGFTWHVMDAPVHAPVNRVSFADATNGIASGSFDGVLVTHDGGGSWKRYRPWQGRTTDVEALPGRWFGLTTSGLYSSTDGLVWKRVHGPFPPYAGTARMDWSSADEGVVASAPDVFITTDGGKAFTRAHTTSGLFFDALSLGEGSGFAVGQDSVHSGQPWVDHVTGTTAAAADLPGRGLADEQERGISQAGRTVYAVGTEGLIARSDDEGTTWAYERPPRSYERSAFYDVDSVDAEHAWIAVHSGRVLIRDAPRLHDITASAHRGLGLGLLGLSALGVVGASAAIGTGRRPAAGTLALASLLAGGGGFVAVTAERTCPASGCTTLAAPAEPVLAGSPSPTTTASASPTGSPTTSASPTPTPTTSSTATPATSPTASESPARPAVTTPAPSATRSPAPSGKPSPGTSATPSGSFTAVLTKAPTCDQRGRPHAGQILLRNTTSQPVSWSATARERTATNAPWARLSPPSGSVTTGGQATILVTPDASLCQPGNDAVTEHVDVRHGTATTSVAVTVTPQT
ncbi:MAG: hypothetical protein ABR549_03220 [Mycobacteriales bacterium]